MLPRLIYPICMSTLLLQFQFNAALRSAICFVFTMKLKYFTFSVPMILFLLQKRKERNYNCFAVEIFHIHSDLAGVTEDAIYVPSGRDSQTERLGTFKLFTSVVTDWCDFDAPRGPLSCSCLQGEMRHFLSDRLPSWFLWGEKHHVNLMCPGPTRYTSMEKDACSHLCNHSGRSRGHTSPVSHFRANLSFHSPSLHIKQHKWLNLHDRICNMANQVSDSIKHYTGTLS